MAVRFLDDESEAPKLKARFLEEDLPEDIPLVDSGPARAPIRGEVPVEPREIWSTGVDLTEGRTFDAYTPEFEARNREMGGDLAIRKYEEEQAIRNRLTESRAGINALVNPYGYKIGDRGLEELQVGVKTKRLPPDVLAQVQQLGDIERPAAQYLQSLNPQPEAEGHGGFTTAALGNLGAGLAGAAGGVMQEFEFPGKIAADPKNQSRLDAVNQRLADLRSRIEKNPNQAASITPEITRYSEEATLLSKQPSQGVIRAAGEMRAEAAQVPGARGSLGRAVGSVAAFVPAMTMGPSGMAGIGLATAQAAADAKTSTQTAVENELRAQGLMSEYEISLAAQEAGNKAAIKTAITMPLYIGAGKLAAGATAKALPSLTGGAAFAAQAGTATAANVGVGALMRTLEGEEAMPNLEQFATDALWGFVQGAGESSKASQKAVSKARTELRSRGWTEQQIDAPYERPEGLMEITPRTGTKDGMQFPIPSDAAPTTKPPIENPFSSLIKPEAAPAPAPSGIDAIVPAIRVGGKVVRGNQGESHLQIRDRYIEEHPDEAGDVLMEFDHPRRNPNFFVDEAGNELSREQLQELTGKVDSQGLAELQAERRLGPGAANIEEPFAKLPSTSNKEASVNVERAAENLDPIIKEARVGNLETVDRAETILEQNPRRGAEIVERLRTQNPQERTIALEDGAILLVDRVRLKNERALNEQRALDENTTAEERQVAQNEVTRLSNEIYAMDAAAQGARSTWGRFGQLWQRTMRDDFTFDAMERRASLAKGKPLTEPERQRVQKQSEEIQKAEDAFEKRRTLLEEELPVDEAIKAIETEARKNPEFTPEVQSIAQRIEKYFDGLVEGARKRMKARGVTLYANAFLDPTYYADAVLIGIDYVRKGANSFGKWASKMRKSFGGESDPYLQDIWKSANKQIDDQITKRKPKDPAKVKEAVTKVNAVTTADSIGEKMKTRAGEGDTLTQMGGDIQKLVETLVRGGIKERGALVDTVHEVMKGVDPSITRRQASDAISGYGDFKPLSKDAVKVEVRDLKGQLQQVSKLEDIQSRVPLKRTGVERAVPSTEQRNLIQQVNEAKKKFGVVVTDTATQLKSATDAIETRLGNQIKDITRQIENGEDPRTRTPAPTNERIEQLRALRDRVQSTLSELRGKPQATPEQRAAIVRKNLESQVAELERRIKTGDTKGKPPEVRSAEIDALRAQRDALKAELNELKVVDQALVEDRKFDSTMKAVEALEAKLTSGDTSSSGKRRLGPDSEMVVKAKENLAALRKQMQDLRKAENPPKPEEQRKLESAMKAVEKSIAEYDRRLRVGDMAAKAKRGTTSPELEAMRAERDAMRDLFREMRDGPPRTREEIAIAALKSRLTKQIAEKMDRMARGDFSPALKRPPLDISKDPEAVRLRADAERVKAQYEQDRIKAEFASQNLAKKALRLGKETLNLPRAILSSWDLSAVLRQGGLISLGNPTRALRATGEMFKSLVSRRQAELADARIRSRPNAPLYDESGLYLAPLEDARIGRQEEAIMSQFAQKIPGIKASNRAFVSFLNRLRADSFDAMVASLNRPGAPLTSIEMKAIANYINVSTGRGDLGKASQAATTLATIFFSPRLLASRFQTIARPMMGFRQGGETSMRVRKAVAKEYGKLLLGLGTIYGLASMSGASIELDPRSSDFGKLRFGNTRVDPLAGLAQVTTLIGRLITGEKKSVGGNVVSLRGEDLKYGADDASDVIMRFGRTKFTPVLGAIFDSLSGRNVVGEKVTAKDVVKNLTIPLGFRDVADVMKEQGIPKGLALELLNLFGWGLQHYER